VKPEVLKHYCFEALTGLNNSAMKIEKCTMEDFNEITRDICDFWGSDRTLHLFFYVTFAKKEK
jgi:hypothetical protein